MALSKTERSEIAKKAYRKRIRDASKKKAKRKTAVAKTTKRRKPSRRRTTLSQMINPMQTNAGMRAAGSGAVGGGLAALVEKVMKPDMPETRKALWIGGIGFAIAAVANAPYTGAGMAGVAAYKLMSEVGLAENRQVYADPIEQLPMMLDASGNAMMLSEDESGGLYLEENGELYLQEGDASYQVAYAPDFGQEEYSEYEEM